ncbi:MAG: ribosomal protein S18-alanine N-acetyltransferase [Eubacteriales bacterium]|nr:ribosomal protein S18-alanine N-acetyltransferase [Eubacteriales bacterium]
MLELRPMREEDLEQVEAIERAIFSCPWTLEGFRSSMQAAGNLYVTALWDGNVAGYCGLWRSFEEGDITNVAVGEDFRRRGIAENMLRFLMELAGKEGVTQFTLEVRKSNEAALRLYEKLGFCSEGIRKNFYEKPVEDAVIMWKR